MGYAELCFHTSDVLSVHIHDDLFGGYQPHLPFVVEMADADQRRA